MGVDSTGIEGERLALMARRLGALIAIKVPPSGRASRSMRSEEETSSERRPGAPQRLPTSPFCWWANRSPDQQREGEPGPKLSLYLYRSQVNRFDTEKFTVSTSTVGQ